MTSPSLPITAFLRVRQLAQPPPNGGPSLFVDNYVTGIVVIAIGWRPRKVSPQIEDGLPSEKLQQKHCRKDHHQKIAPQPREKRQNILLDTAWIANRV
jgi:hypothetical protein